MATVLMISLIGTAVLAEEDVDLISDDSSAISEKKDSSTNVFWDEVKMKYTFNKQKKAEIALKIADKRALQAGQLTEKGKYTEAKELVKKHKEAVEKAEKYNEDVAQDGDAESVKQALRETVMMQEKLEIHKEKFILVHSRILERQSEKISEEKLTHLEEVFSNIEEKSLEAENRIAQKQENLIARYKILTGATDEEVNSLIEGFRDEFQQIKEERHKTIQEEEKLIEHKKELIKERHELNKESEKEEFEESEKNTKCTKEAKLCSDGSYVERGFPNCEFAECP